MTIVSFSFVILLLVTTLLYFIVPQKYQWTILLLASYVFFFVNSKWLVLVLLATTLVTFFIGRWIHAVNAKAKAQLRSDSSELSKAEQKQIKALAKTTTKRILVLGIAIDLGILLFLKYFNFFADCINIVLPGNGIGRLNLLLPLGISFYTLQALAYMVDIYRGRYEPDSNPFKFMLFMSFFPQIIQGPIARHNQLAHQLYAEHKFDSKRLMMGIQLIAWGWMKKMIVADRIALVVDTLFGNADLCYGWLVIIAAASYSVQVYMDFSGGMDVARGVSQIFGIELELNFRQPYFSRSIEEFWRRWHITLGSWMRDYVFYPLSLSKTFSRIGKASIKRFGKYIGKRLPSFLAMFIVYFLVGFWHGPDLKYIVYGVWNGLFIVSGILLEGPYEKTRQFFHIKDSSRLWIIFQMCRTFCLCSIGRVFSRAGSLNDAFGMLRRMFIGLTDFSFLRGGIFYESGVNTSNWILLFISIICFMVVDYLHEKDVHIRETILKQHIIIRWLIYYGTIFLIIVFGMYGPGFDSASFIYEQF